jgi:alcohol dehydrogenase (cytochrome c)
VFFGDVGGNFYALDSASGQKLWGQSLDAAIGGGLITYMANGAQQVAVTAGFTLERWSSRETVKMGLPRQVREGYS